jgi:hypothetical protein
MPVRRAGEIYLDTYELEPDAIEPATRVAASFGMSLQELPATGQEGAFPGQGSLTRPNRWPK